MNPDLVLFIIWKRWQKLKKMKLKLQEWKVRRRHILQLFGIWKLMVHKKEKTRHRKWVRSIFTERRRLLQGANDNLVKEMEFIDHEMFYNYCRMSTQMFDQLLDIVGPILKNVMSFKIQYQLVPSF